MRRFDDGRVFISHASVDSGFAERLDADLRQAHFTTWLDRRDLKAGDRLPASLAEAIGAARAMIAVISPSTAQARWMMRELDQATHRMVQDRAFKVIPALIADAQVPEGVRDLVYADFRADYAAGLDSVLEALRALFKDDWHYNFRTRHERVKGLLQDVFGTFMSAMALGGYQIPDLDLVPIGRPAGARVSEFDPPDDPCDVAVEVDPGEIDPFWLEGFATAWDSHGARAGLLIMEETPVVDFLEPIAEGVFASSGYPFVCAVVIGPEASDEVAHRRLTTARDALQNHIWRT